MERPGLEQVATRQSTLRLTLFPRGEGDQRGGWKKLAEAQLLYYPCHGSAPLGPICRGGTTFAPMMTGLSGSCPSLSQHPLAEQHMLLPGFLPSPFCSVAYMRASISPTQ